VLGLFLMLGLSACATDSARDSSSSTAGDQGSRGSAATYGEAEVAQEPADAGAAGDTVTSSADVITTGSATVRTDDPATAAGDFATRVSEQGGRVAETETSTRNDRPEATVTARVPSGDYRSTIDGLADQGEVIAQSTQSTDVGQEKVDLEARQRALQTSIDRLTELMDGAESVEDLLAAEDTLTQRQAELDGLTSQLDYLTDQVAFSTLTVTFTTDEAGYQSPGVLERAWDAFLSSLEAVVIVFMGMLPWLVILAIIAAVVVAVLRRRRKRRAGK